MAFLIFLAAAAIARIVAAEFFAGDDVGGRHFGFFARALAEFVRGLGRSRNAQTSAL